VKASAFSASRFQIRGIGMGLLLRNGAAHLRAAPWSSADGHAPQCAPRFGDGVTAGRVGEDVQNVGTIDMAVPEAFAPLMQTGGRVYLRHHYVAGKAGSDVCLIG
jgi:hypothetical protein